MNVFKSLESLLLLFAAFLGLALSQIDAVVSIAHGIITPLFVLMLYGMFLSVPIDALKQSLNDKPFTRLSLVLNFVWTPVFAALLGWVFFYDHTILWIGLILLLITPCTDWYLGFTKLARGDTALSVSILPLNLTIQLIAVLMLLFMFTGTIDALTLETFVTTVVILVLLPLILVIITRKLIKSEAVTSRMSRISSVALVLAVTAIFASNSQTMLDNLSILTAILPPLVIFYIVTYFISTRVGKRLKWSHEKTTSLVFTTMARNSPLILALALTLFPESPAIALIMVAGSLIELPLLLIAASMRTLYYR